MAQLQTIQILSFQAGFLTKLSFDTRGPRLQLLWVTHFIRENMENNIHVSEFASVDIQIISNEKRFVLSVPYGCSYDEAELAIFRLREHLGKMAERAAEQAKASEQSKEEADEAPEKESNE